MQPSCLEPSNLGIKLPVAGRVVATVLQEFASRQACLGKLRGAYTFGQQGLREAAMGVNALFVILDMGLRKVTADLNADTHTAFEECCCC